MASILIRFRNNTNVELLKEVLRDEAEWKDEVQEICILEEDRVNEIAPPDRGTGRFLFIHVRGGIQLVEISEICCLEKIRRSILIHMRDESSWLFYGKFEDVMPSLTPAFCQCHKSYVVNLEQVEGLQRHEFLMRGGERVPVSQKKYRTVREYFQHYMNNGGTIEKNSAIIEK